MIAHCTCTIFFCTTPHTSNISPSSCVNGICFDSWVVFLLLSFPVNACTFVINFEFDERYCDGMNWVTLPFVWWYFSLETKFGARSESQIRICMLKIKRTRANETNNKYQNRYSQAWIRVKNQIVHFMYDETTCK